jgi:hypothetical protein
MGTLRREDQVLPAQGAYGSGKLSGDGQAWEYAHLSSAV